MGRKGIDWGGDREEFQGNVFCLLVGRWVSLCLDVCFVIAMDGFHPYPSDI